MRVLPFSKMPWPIEWGNICVNPKDNPAMWSWKNKRNVYIEIWLCIAEFGVWANLTTNIKILFVTLEKTYVGLLGSVSQKKLREARV